jgi:hypothetical protein
MNLPVFAHTLRSLHALINNEQEPLKSVSDLIKYDPGLAFSLLEVVGSSGRRKEITTVTQAISLLGSENVERHILSQDLIIEEEYTLLWCYAVIAGETASAISTTFSITAQEEAFLVGILPALGMLYLSGESPKYKKVYELLLKVPLEDRIFIEERLFRTNLLEQMENQPALPRVFCEIVALMKKIIIQGESGRQQHLMSGEGVVPDKPSKLSVAYETLQLYHLMETAGAAARAILFPPVVEAQEKFRELSKRYFKIHESEIEELLADIVERFEEVCAVFGLQDLARSILAPAEQYISSGLQFSTASPEFQRSLDDFNRALQDERNIIIFGEPGIGKRLLVASVKYNKNYPRKDKPLISLHCGALEPEVLEMELFGDAVGFIGRKRNKGVFSMADGGTVHLKDIERLPIAVQERLARVMAKDEVQEAAAYDVRLIISSRADILAETEVGRFSGHLLSVLNPFMLFIPPLRERRGDISFIANGIIEKYNLDLKDERLRLELGEYYETHPFPNNLKDLKRLLFYLSAKQCLKS